MVLRRTKGVFTKKTDDFPWPVDGARQSGHPRFGAGQILEAELDFGSLFERSASGHALGPFPNQNLRFGAPAWVSGQVRGVFIKPDRTRWFRTA